MFIEDICLEGFKSYATKTVVPNFDEQFNAITGLNGSGKSNILDSICFVLGITNLSHVRAGNLQELVYKQGQAGVTKATVSITFNNSNPEKSPAGYEHCEKLVVTRQIVIGGRNKYLINGHTAQPGRVQDLFHSVQLNVNNPHFLIMQGRVTKVLNMKPPEILAMLEEAAGTRMYETKRTSALKTLDKKQTKVEEINTVLEEEILPALEKLRKERGMYMQWVSANDQLDKLRRFCIAYDFTSAEESQDNSKADQTKLQDRIATLTDYCAQLDTSTDEINTKIEELTLERESQMGGELKSLADEADKLSKNLVKETSGWTNKKDSLKSEQDGVKKLQKTMAEIEEAAAKKAADLERISKDNGDLQSQWDAAVKNSADAEQELANVQAGGSGTNEDGKSKSFAEQVSDAKSAASSAESEAKQMDLKMKHMEKELAAKSKLLPTKQKEFEKLERDLASHQSAVSTAQEQLGKLGYDEARAEELKETCAREQDAVRACREEVDKLSSQLSRVRFDYKDPERGFDRSKVKGVVAKLLRVKEPETATALEVLAGGKLYQVVVDTDATSKALLTRGQLSQRVTIIPLNRIKARTASPQQLSSASRLVGNDAALALSLVGYEEDVQSAIAYVFGMGFVCKDDEAAKKVAFAKDIMISCVTLAGDLFNPSGTLTGGSRSSGASVLSALSHLLEAEGRLDMHHKALEAALHQLRAVQTSEKEFLRLRREVELKSHALTLLEERIKLSEAHQLAETVEHLKAEVEACMQSGKGARERREELVAHAKALEAEMKDFAATRGARLKAAEGAVKVSKAALSAARDAFKGMEAEMRDLTAERAALLEDRKELNEQVQTAEATVLALEEEVHTKGGKVAECREAYEAAAAALQERRARAQACDTEITTLGKDKAKLAKKQTDASVESKKTEHKLARLEKEAAEATQRVAKLLAEYPWIQSERHLFGVEGSAYDWAARDPQEAFTQLKEITETHEKMAKKVNKKVLSMFDKAEGEYKELVDKKAIVLKDKSKIQQVISELDEKKALALKATWEKVNKDFGSIFSTLLPGTMAKLEPPEGGSVLDGLEVKVAFGSVWKQSLTELSGGQRSLLALSLILSLLMFKPAPIYILDEVDAALDLSHTQNIGRMIKTHFPQSQFVVVSLKEGMFSNANVIYRTKFIDGVSTVTRTVPALTESDHNSRKNNASAKAVAAAADKAKKIKRTNQENQAPVH